MRAQLEAPLVVAVAEAVGILLESALQCSRDSAWRSNLVRAFVQEAKDPQQFFADWLRDGAPISVVWLRPSCRSQGSHRRCCGIGSELAVFAKENQTGA